MEWGSEWGGLGGVVGFQFFASERAELLLGFLEGDRWSLGLAVGVVDAEDGVGSGAEECGAEGEKFALSNIALPMLVRYEKTPDPLLGKTFLTSCQ
jgi:hypothetical protein